MCLRKFINFISTIRKVNLFKKNATLLGKNYLLGRSSFVSIKDGSVKDDIIIDDNIKIHGAINSQNNGKIYIGKFVNIGYNSCLLAVDNIYIGDYTTISYNVVITDNNNHPINPSFRKYMSMMPADDDSTKWKHSAHAPVVIGKNCWIGQNSRIHKGVVLGDNCIVAANAVVTKSAPANCILAGNPARIVKTDIDQVEAPTTCEGYNEYVKQ